MWRTARKSDYGTDASGVFFCVKSSHLLNIAIGIAAGALPVSAYWRFREKGETSFLF